MLPTFFAAIVVLGGLVGRGHRVLYWQMAMCVFGGGAAFLLPALGGANIVPAVAFLPFLMLRAWSERERTTFGANKRLARASFWILAVAIWGVLSAFLLPRLLASTVEIMTIDRDSGDAVTVLIPLRPVSGNITQAGYTLGAALAFMSMRVLLSRAGRMEHFKRAVLLAATLNVLFAVLNLLEFYAGAPPVLELLRNAGYVQFNNDVSGGLVRIQGTFSETSMFSAFTLPLFAFCFSLWLSDRKARYPGILAVILLGLLLSSTSGTAYTGLALYMACVTGQLMWTAYTRGSLPRLEWLVMVVGSVIVLVGAAFIMELDATKKVIEFFGVTVADKMTSSSGEVRSSWNAQAWRNFVDTYGLGVGMGSGRASSFVLVLLSNLGVIGAFLFGAFMREVWVGASLESPEDGAIPRAARQAALAGLIAASMSLPIFDLGVAFYAYAAAATVDPLRQQRRERAMYEASRMRYA